MAVPISTPGLRPVRSERGPQTSWPSAKPPKKIVTVSWVVVSDAPNASAVTGIAGRLMSMVIAVIAIRAAISAMKAPDPGLIGRAIAGLRLGTGSGPRPGTGPPGGSG